MKRIAVFALTTGGPVQIQRITRERAPLSMLVLGRGSERLPLSDRYDDFVYPGGGPVERFFGPFPPGGFRLELSAPIDSGDSWQLAAFVAHALLAAGDCGLCREAAEADTILCLTGVVDFDGMVGGVGHIPEKLHAASEQFRAWREADAAVFLVVPRGEDHDHLLAGEPPPGLTLMAAAEVRELCRDLGIALPEGQPVPEAPPAPGDRARPDRKRRRLWELLLMALILLAGGYLLLAQWTAEETAKKVAETAAKDAPPATKTTVAAAPAPKQPARKPAIPIPVQPQPAAPAPSAGQPHLSVFERHAPEGYGCEQVYFGNAKAELRAVPLAAPGQAVASRGDGLCGLLLRIELGSDSLHALVELDVMQGRLVGALRPPGDLSGRRLVKGRRDWVVDLPHGATGPVRYRLSLTTSPTPIRGRPKGGRTVHLRHEVLR